MFNKYTAIGLAFAVLFFSIMLLQKTPVSYNGKAEIETVESVPFYKEGDKLLVMTSKNTVVLGTDINEFSVTNTINKLNTSNEKQMYLMINSPGGAIFEGQRLLDYLDTTDKEIVCVARIAASMAFVTLQHCKTRLVLHGSVLMAHHALINTADGNTHTVKQKDKADPLYRIDWEMDSFIAKRLGITIEEWFKIIDEPQYWIGADEIMGFKLKLVDDVVKVSCLPGDGACPI
jgi:ATP-dependent protease ClpP protease subunit